MSLRRSLASGALLLLAACGRGQGGSPTEASSGPQAGLPPPGPTLPPPTQPAPIATAPAGGQPAMPLSFAPLARRADPAVATVRARTERERIPGRGRSFQEAFGTAFVYDPQGFLLTNNHVIEDATEVTVGFVDGKELRGTVVGRDKHTDVAVLKVDGQGLPSLPLGDSDVLEVGDWVVAIGNPFGLSHTVSAGILSAKGRTRDDVKGLDPSGYFNFLQTDASINPGNSGGPLLNVQGEVVGINAAVRANANNIGFAIPINMVKQLLPMLLRDGKIRRSAIGVEVYSVDPGKRADRKGAWVRRVLPGGPADRAGLAEDDVIIAFDGKPVADPNELRWLASIAGVNKTTTLKIARKEREFEVKVTLTELPDAPSEPEEP